MIEPSRGCPRCSLSAWGRVAIVVEDEASPDQLATVGARGLYGLYQGVPRTAWGADKVAVPSKITLFRGPLAAQHLATPDALAAGVTETVYHEIAHHFGISDARLHELQAASRPLGGERAIPGDASTFRNARTP